MNTILIIEDDTALADGLMRALSSEQINARSCNGINTARMQLEQNIYSLILLDINLPDGNGFDFLKELKTKYDTPVIILTANDMESDIVSGLELGADDYITKPFSLAILRARVNAQLRKKRRFGTDDNNGQSSIVYCSDGDAEYRYVLNDYIFDFRRMEFTHAGTAIELSKTEQKLLHILTENAGITLTRGRLIDFVWSDGAEYVDENALSVAIKRLRDKLDAQDYIRTVYGIGYVWNAD
ncbi:MAG: response regulator transcription factor [Lachnospiraceae bacterium]|nr:response regulator transcription factor [Lachnospiraceae bacterium]